MIIERNVLHERIQSAAYMSLLIVVDLPGGDKNVSGRHYVLVSRQRANCSNFMIANALPLLKVNTRLEERSKFNSSKYVDWIWAGRAADECSPPSTLEMTDRNEV